ncbi:MAG: ATP-dependent metallopeptidase FtsH/Yme1/Tma family protein, partial [Gemmatimonadota bacterium]
MTNRSRRPAPPGPPGRRPPPRPRFSSLSKSLLLWALILFVPLAIWMQLFRPKESSRVEIKYSEFTAQLDAENLASVTIIEKEIQGVLKERSRAMTPSGPRDFTEFSTVIPFEDPALVQRLEDKGVAVEAQAPSTNWLLQLVGILPWILIIALWIFLIRQMQGGGSRAFAFGKSRAKLLSADAPKVTFEDVAGADEAKQELEEIIDFLRDPKKFQRLGGRIPKGVLLLGPPGTGKTLLARAVAGEAGVPFFSMSGSDFVEMFVGVGASVTGDTPVLVRTDRGVELIPIGDFVDRYYEADEEGKVLPVFGVETLGYESRASGFRGRLDGFASSAWKGVRGVYRHRVEEIHEVHYLGGTLRTTGDHSVFVRCHGGIKAKAVRDLKPGDVLVDLPSGDLSSHWASVEVGVAAEALLVHGPHGPGLFGPERLRSPSPFDFEKGSAEDVPSIVTEVIRRPYEGFVYDLCGCENEAFFGGEKPVLLHNSRVRDLFEQGKAHAPCIIFVDEIDAVGRHRGAGLGGGHDEREQTLNQLLVEMDGFESNEGVILIAATNRPDVLDPALLRPGRFDRQVVVDRPDVRGREGIFKVHTRDIPLSPDVDLRVLAKGTPGLAGADIENIVNEAALLAARNNRKSVTMIDFEDAKDKVMMGAERKSLVITDDEKRSIAFHEAGHALVRMLTPAADPVHKVTIIPRGRALGVTHFLPVDERHIYTREWCEDQLTALLGGRAAEVLVLKATTTGAGDDLQRATDLGRRMVTKWGMSEILGPLTYGDEPEQIFLGREIATHRDYSEETARLIDQEVKSIVGSAFERALEILTDNEDALHRLAESLLEREILDNEEIRLVIAGEELAPEPPVDEPGGKKARISDRGAGVADLEPPDDEVRE